MIRSYFALLLEDTPAAEAVGKMKQFASWFTHGVPGGAALRRELYAGRTGAELLAAVDRFFEPRLCPASDGEAGPFPEGGCGDAAPACEGSWTFADDASGAESAPGRSDGSGAAARLPALACD
jgi:hypothetical protein